MANIIATDSRTRLAVVNHPGWSRRAAAEGFGVSPICAVKLTARVPATGSAASGRRSRSPGSGKLGAFKAMLIAWVQSKPHIIMPELAARLRREHAVIATPISQQRILCQAGWIYEEALAAAQTARADVARRRRRWLR